MKILLVGGGGREHAIAWKLTQSPLCETLYCAPGNAGIAECAQCVPIAAEEVESLVSFAKEKAVDLVIAGPEAPLVLGLADRLWEEGIAVFGPCADAARLEGSKAFMKDLCARHGIPTASYGRFSDIAQARAFIERSAVPIVVKTDGLAAGKGVIIAQNKEEAIEAASAMLSGESFGDAGHEIVIEEFLDGEELSFFAIADGKTVVPFGSAQDHKRVFDGDLGPNTGGMGAYSPAHMMSVDLERKIMTRIIEPAIAGMAAEGMPFTGVLFAGIMLVDGEPVLLEFNVRFGDPECQTLMMRLDADLAETLLYAAKGGLEKVQHKISWSPETALCVVMAAKGYPGGYAKNTPLSIAANPGNKDTKIFHAGTALDLQGNLVSTGGRVLGVTALGKTVAQAQARAYEAVKSVNWPEGFCRTDIGWRAIRKSAA